MPEYYHKTDQQAAQPKCRGRMAYQSSQQEAAKGSNDPAGMGMDAYQGGKEYKRNYQGKYQRTGWQKTDQAAEGNGNGFSSGVIHPLEFPLSCGLCQAEGRSMTCGGSCQYQTKKQMLRRTKAQADPHGENPFTQIQKQAEDALEDSGMLEYVSASGILVIGNGGDSSAGQQIRDDFAVHHAAGKKTQQYKYKIIHSLLLSN